MTFTLPKAASVAVNPSQAEMRGWVLEHMPRIVETEFGNLAYEAEILARLSRSTFFVSDVDIHQNRISSHEAAQWAARQDAYIADKDMILIEGYIGPDPATRTGSRVMIERTQSNIPAMQQQLYFPKDDDWTPLFTVIYTPGLKAPGKPNNRLITVDLENYVTRVFGSDYFGESKMGGLRMWNHYIYQQGGLALHSGLKSYPDIDGVERSVLILGLSGTGKTTMTFRQQLGSLPIQDDFNALLPGGKVITTENGCFAKTFGLDPDDEPTIYGGTARPDAWLENTHVNLDGTVDFFNDDHTRNGRSTFPLANIRHRDPSNVPNPGFLLLLNRNENIVPAVARVPRDRASAYFMLGETKGTSAGGAAEAGKHLRVPGTNPFFFDNDALQGNRFQELLESMPDLSVFVLNTGSVGGPMEEGSHGRNISIADSSAVLAGIVADEIEWTIDPDFGYEVAARVPGLDDMDKLQPRTMYERQGRSEEYHKVVAQLKDDRRAYLAGFDDLDPAIVSSI